MTSNSFEIFKSLKRKHLLSASHELGTVWKHYFSSSSQCPRKGGLDISPIVLMGKQRPQEGRLFSMSQYYIIHFQSPSLSRTLGCLPSTTFPSYVKE